MKTRDALFGVAVGDALGVPVEFRSRESIAHNPVTDMIGYGTHMQAPGTWSDDSSLTFCLAEALTAEYNLHNIALNFQSWLHNNLWTAHGEVFDVGITTRAAIGEFARGTKPQYAGGSNEHSNGNGSLMRILPLLFHIKDLPLEERYQKTKDVSSITHGHIRSVLSCFYYLEFARHLLHGKTAREAYTQMQTEFSAFLKAKEIHPRETEHFDRLLQGDIAQLSEQLIYGSGYVIHCLHASIWCLLTTDSYAAAVLKAVNLGEDTDTTGAVTGGLAGLVYGYENIPQHWVQQIARKEDIENLATRLGSSTTS
jgi:ADP-ribosylglycohydrolase